MKKVIGTSVLIAGYLYSTGNDKLARSIVRGTRVGISSTRIAVKYLIVSYFC